MAPNPNYMADEVVREKTLRLCLSNIIRAKRKRRLLMHMPLLNFRTTLASARRKCEFRVTQNNQQFDGRFISVYNSSVFPCGMLEVISFVIFSKKLCDSIG
jgi:hypothetical protein